MTPAAGDVAAIRTRGRRLTKQRRLIWETLLASRGAHLSAEEIETSVRSTAPDLHRATIYRTLDVLVQDGLVLRTELGSRRSYYELASEHRHHHVVCSACGAVAHIHDADIEALVATVQAASGYSDVGADELTFSGRCLDCRPATARRS
jgi:Fur family ferric uptake transcriptional regulator